MQLKWGCLLNSWFFIGDNSYIGNLMHWLIKLVSFKMAIRPCTFNQWKFLFTPFCSPFSPWQWDKLHVDVGILWVSPLWCRKLFRRKKRQGAVLRIISKKMWRYANIFQPFFSSMWFVIRHWLWHIFYFFTVGFPTKPFHHYLHWLGNRFCNVLAYAPISCEHVITICHLIASVQTINKFAINFLQNPAMYIYILIG